MSPTQSNCVLNVPNAIKLCCARISTQLNCVTWTVTQSNCVTNAIHSNFFGYQRSPRFGKIVKEMFSNKDYLDWDAPKLQKTLQQENWMG